MSRRRRRSDFGAVKKKEKKARGARQLQLLWQRPAEREQGEAQSTMRDLSLARDVRACVPARFSREREGKRKRKKMNSTSVDFAVLLFSASFASARFSTLFSF